MNTCTQYICSLKKENNIHHKTKKLSRNLTAEHGFSLCPGNNCLHSPDKTDPADPGRHHGNHRPGPCTRTGPDQTGRPLGRPDWLAPTNPPVKADNSE